MKKSNTDKPVRLMNISAPVSPALSADQNPFGDVGLGRPPLGRANMSSRSLRQQEAVCYSRFLLLRSMRRKGGGDADETACSPLLGLSATDVVDYLRILGSQGGKVFYCNTRLSLFKFIALYRAMRVSQRCLKK
jgi:hypothetical protein